MQRRSYGLITVEALVDGHATLPGEEAFGDQSEMVKASYPGVLNENGDLHFPLIVFLIEAPGRVILVDAGAGPRDSWVVSGELIELLSQRGITPSAITDVILTHLHWDHIGWLSQKGRVIFENADLHVHEADWKYFYDAFPGATKRLQPVAGRVNVWTDDHTFIPGVTLLHTPGHTPGSSSVVVSGEGKQLVLLGDVAHCPFQLQNTGVSFSSDVDPEAARLSRERILRDFSDGATELMGCHFPSGPIRHQVQMEAR